MHDIVLIDPSVDERKLPNLGLAAISSYLQIRGYDAVQVPLQDVNNYADHSVFGVSVWDHTYATARMLTQSIKRVKPDATVIWGGWAAMAMPEWMLENNPAADVIVLQDGERRVERLIDHFRDPASSPGLQSIDGIVHRGSGVVVRQPVTSYFDLDQLPVPKDGDYGRVTRNDGKGVVYVELARGCYGSCAYCQHITKMRFRDPIKVAAEIEFWHRNGHDEFYIGNDNSIANVKLLDALIAELERRRVRIRVWLTGRPNDVLKGMHVIERVFTSEHVRPQSIEMGIEANSASMLVKLRRGLTPEVNRKAMDALFRLREAHAPEAGINANIILFPHWEMTIEDFAANVRFLGDYRCSRDTMSLQLYGVPGTPLWDEMMAKGFAPGARHGRRVTDYPFDDPEVEQLFDLLIRQPRARLESNPFAHPMAHYQFQYAIHDQVTEFYRTGDIVGAAREFARQALTASAGS